jgi:L-noviosyl transferase
MKVLFSSTPLAGHFGPMVPFVLSLLGSGHEVMVAAPSALGPSVAAAGADSGR